MPLALAWMVALMGPATVHAATLSVVDSDGLGVTGFRWVLQEDTTRPSIPGAAAMPGHNLSLSFHSSHAPVVLSGRTTTTSQVQFDVPDESKRYFVSVLPDSGYTLGGGAVAPDPLATTVVTVNKLPLKTAQISVYVFEDDNPTNNAPDLPAEHGLAGFTVQVFEAGGSYGANGGRMLYDVFGNPLGTSYNADGSVNTTGTGTITTDVNGVAVIKNLAQGKYTLFVAPPSGQGWVQTATIEGTPGVDAWVKPNEPSFFQEFGPPGHHVFIGFTRAHNHIPAPAPGVGTGTITGRIVNQHMSRSPDYAFYNGEAVPRCWVGLNELAAAPGRALYAAPCNPDSTFAIPNVPAGRYQLVVWDEPLDVIFASHNVDVPAGGGDVALMDVPVFNWFGKVKGKVFFDTDNDAFPGPGEAGIRDQAVNLRFRDGSIYQMQATDSEGGYEFTEVFPFFNWLVAEVDFARFKATGVTVTVDGGGPIDWNDPWSFGGALNPQTQATGLPYRIEAGPVLTQGVQTFLGQTNVMQWGKQVYGPGENGGISGMVRYATTRAEDDPRYAAAENWEPGIPNVTVRLYQDFNNDGIVDDLNGDTRHDAADAFRETTTDSWDASAPTGCPGDNMMPITGLAADACFDGLRNFNQVRPAVFDGGYAFGGPDDPLPAGTYIVEALAPEGYQHVKEEDKNVDFGDSYVPGTLALPPPCVNWDDVEGNLLPGRTVPADLALFPGVASVYAGQDRPQCDRKQVRLAVGQNAAADFFLFTEVPVAGQIVGMILNDLANEFDPAAPNFGEKYAPPHLPISIRDWTGREITRVYADQYGTYNALVPSTYTMNAPMPSGVSPNMLTACLNAPMKADGTPDPWFNRQYSQFCYTFQYMPGKTTYLDTPVLPIAAMAGPGRFPLDCEYGNGTPMIHSVTDDLGHGPWVSAAGQRLTITAVGEMAVPNPAWDGTANTPKVITRDFGFGTGGTVGIRTADGLFLPLEGVTWGPGVITGAVPRGVGRAGQLVVTRADTGLGTVHAVTVSVGGRTPIVVPPGGSIQAVIDDPNTRQGDTVSVPPGVYEELVVMHKAIRLQGWGAGSTIINAVKAPAEKLQSWRDEIAMAYANGWFSLLPGQAAGAVDPQNNEPVLFNTDEGAGITVLANRNEFNANRAPRIDGFTITGADHGGAIYVNGHADHLEIANNRIISNQGYYGGGIHIGNPALVNNGVYTDSDNDFIRVHNNQITQNGSLDGAGGGISLYAGTTGYEVVNNFVCGNFAMGGGGGIGHLGLSDNGLIRSNTVIFNESFNQGRTVNGGGILVAGQPALVAGQLSRGAGNVTVTGNLIQGNLAGAGDGGGIQAQGVNGDDVRASPRRAENWHRLYIANNMVVNNIAGLAGGGISLQDVARAEVLHNTVANNESTATAGNAFAPGSPNQSTPQPAGVASHAHSAALGAVLGCGADCFSNPVLANNILWHNRSHFWQIDPLADPPAFGLHPAGYWELAVIGNTAACLSPFNSVLTPGTGICGGAGNRFDDPAFIAEYGNTSPGQTIQQPELTTAIATAPALDEGGNFIDVSFWPLTLINPATGGWFGNYHINGGSPAAGIGANAGVTADFDGQPRSTTPDAGADEIP